MFWQKQIVIISNAYKILCAECHFKFIIGIASFNPHIPLGQKLLLGKRDSSITSNNLGHHFHSGSQGRNWVSRMQDRSLESSKPGCRISIGKPVWSYSRAWGGEGSAIKRYYFDKFNNSDLFFSERPFWLKCRDGCISKCRGARQRAGWLISGQLQ